MKLLLLATAILATATGLLFGCGRYEIQGDGHGRIVRLDRLTGELNYLQGSRLVRIENPHDRRRSLDSLATAHDWGSASYDQYMLRLRTAWRGGRMYYQLGIAPMPPEKVFNFRISLNDAQGFELSSVSLNVPDGSPAPGGINYTGFILLDEDLYRAVRSWSPRVELYSGRVAPEELP